MKTQPTTDLVWAHLHADLRQFIRRRVADDYAADDLLQETFLRIHRSLGTLNEADRLAAWVYQIARRVVHDHYRNAATSPVSLADADRADDSGDSRIQLRCGGTRWLAEMIQSLPEGYREAVQWAEIEGLTQQDVAHRFGITLSGAKSRVQRARAMLRETLEACCTFHFDHAGRLMDCDPRIAQKICKSCES